MLNKYAFTNAHNFINSHYLPAIFCVNMDKLTRVVLHDHWVSDWRESHSQGSL